MKPTHPLAKAPKASLAELAPYPMCLPESSFRTRQILKVAEMLEHTFLQPDITSNSIVLLKNLVANGEYLTLLPMLAVSEEVARGEFVAVRVDSASLQDTSVHLIGRLGRQLTPAPLRLMTALISYLNGYEGCFDRAAHAG